MAEPRLEEIGHIVRFFARPSAAVVALVAPLRVGDRLFIKGRTTDAEEEVRSLQVRHQAVTSAPAGTEVGIHVRAKCRPRDLVYRLVA